MGQTQNKNITRPIDSIVPAVRRNSEMLQRVIAQKSIAFEHEPELENASLSKPVLREKFAEEVFEATEIISAQMQAVLPSADDASEPSVIDSKKRMFLRLAGLGGLGAIAAMLLPKKAHAFIMGSHPASGGGSGVVGIKDSTDTRIDPATEPTLLDIKAQTNLLTFDSSTVGAANLKVNVAAGTVGIKNAIGAGTQINPATEDTLALIQAKTALLHFDGNNLLTSVGGTGNIVGVKDTTNTQINPATDDSLVYLRRMVKLMESQATVDASNRQKVIVDGFGAVVTGYAGSGAGIPRVTVSSDSTFSATINTIAGWGDQMFTDPARTAYAVGIRANLSF